MSKVIRARYEEGTLKPLTKLELREREEVVLEVRRDIIEFARRIRSLVKAGEEPSAILSKERSRFD